jgi:hypothetical protein
MKIAAVGCFTYRKTLEPTGLEPLEWPGTKVRPVRVQEFVQE